MFYLGQPILIGLEEGISRSHVEVGCCKVQVGCCKVQVGCCKVQVGCCRELGYKELRYNPGRCKRGDRSPA